MRKAKVSRLSLADPLQEAVDEKAHLNQVLLDAIPCVALLLRPDREVVLSNKAGQDAGAQIGTQCFATWGQRSDPCPWCLAPKALETGEPQRIEVEALGIVWDAYWIPLGPDLYLHYAFDITERRRVEEELSGTRQYLASLIENSTDAVIATDESGNIALFNQGAEAMLGYSQEEVIGRRVTMLYDGEAPAKEVMHQMRLGGGKVSNFEVSKRAKDGTLVPVLISASILYDEAGREVGTVGFSKDIRERKEAVDALRESEERYRSLAETSTVGIWHITSEGETIYLNPAMCKMLEIEGPEELEGHTHHAFFTPESVETMKAELAKRRKGISNKYEVELVGRRGTRRNVLISGAPVLSYDGTLRSLSGAFVDITERKKMEQRLARLNRAFLSLGRDFEENIRLLTMACGELLGATCALYNRLEGELLVSVGQWQTPPDYDPVDEPYGHLCYDVMRRDGESGVFYVSNLPDTPYYETDPNVARFGLKTYVGHPVTRSGEVVGSICVVYQDDVVFSEEDAKTLEVLAKAIGIEEERKQAGESLVAAHTELVKAYDRLSQAQSTALASEKLAAVGRLTAGVSHEILNPLNTITISLHMLLNNPEVPPNVAEDIQLLMEQARRITKISQDLLFFSRQRPPERRPVDVNETARRTLDLMAYELRLNNVEVELKLAEGLPKVQADQDQLQQVVLNLFTNARDAMREGGRLVVTTREAPPLWKSEVSSVELRVEDTGGGIGPENMDKIFEPFFTTKAEGEGTGMGLSICHGIIEAHGGRIWAENAPEGGAVFVIHLPLGQADDSPP